MSARLDESLVARVLGVHPVPILSASDAGDILVWDVASGKLVDRLSLGRGAVRAISVAARLLLVASDGGVAGLFELPPLDAQGAYDAIAAQTNMRVCRAQQTTVALLPFPESDTPWAPDAACP